MSYLLLPILLDDTVGFVATIVKNSCIIYCLTGDSVRKIRRHFSIFCTTTFQYPPPPPHRFQTHCSIILFSIHRKNLTPILIYICIPWKFSQLSVNFACVIRGISYSLLIHTDRKRNIVFVTKEPQQILR
jgi:hypothetical protein